MRTAEPRQPTMVRLPMPDRERLDRLVASNGMSQNATMVEALRLGLAQLERRSGKRKATR